MLMLDMLNNKVLLYIVSRYAIYFIEFLTSMLVAARLGPFYFGVWGSILLLLNYFQQFHFGIANSVNVLLVHHIREKEKCEKYISNSMLLVMCLSVLVLTIYVVTTFVDIPLIMKFGINNYLLGVCLIAILQYYRMLFINIFRVYNRLGYVVFAQSIVVVLNFVAVLCYDGEALIHWLVWGHLIGNLATLLLALFSDVIPRFHMENIHRTIQVEIVKKGIMLFLYNSCFYFILISIRTLIGCQYTVEEFGLFTFSYTLSNAMLLLLDAVAFVVFPKLISKLSSHNVREVKEVMTGLQRSYVTSSHLLVYIAILLFPILLFLLPQYKGAEESFCLISLTILINMSSFVYSTTLIARNYERRAALISIVALVVNGVLGWYLSSIVHIAYIYVIFSTMIAYIVFTLLTVIAANEILTKQSIASILAEAFPLKLLLPFVLCLLVAVLKINYWCYIIPLVTFLIFNRKDLIYMFTIVETLFQKPEVVDLK